MEIPFSPQLILDHILSQSCPKFYGEASYLYKIEILKCLNLFFRFVFVNHPDQPNFAQVTSIIDWLHSLQLDRLIRLFISAGYRNLSQICHFDQSDINNVVGNSITLDEQTRLLDGLKRVRSQLVLISSKSLLPGEGYLV